MDIDPVDFLINEFQKDLDMNLMPIPFLFIREHASLSWRDALWGYEHQVIAWSDVVKLAKDRFHSDSDPHEIELSCLDKSNTFRVSELLRELAASEPEKLRLMSVKKWLYLMLAWTLDNKDRIDDPELPPKFSLPQVT